MAELLQQQGWNTTDFVAVVTLIVTVFGLGFTVLNTYQTSKRTEGVLRSSLSAKLEIPINPHRQRKDNPYAEAGIHLSHVARMVDDRPRVQIKGTVQNVGRYAASHVDLSAHFGLTNAEIMNAPWDILEPFSPPSDFDILFLLTPLDPDDLTSGLVPLFMSGPLWITIAFRDGNPGTQLMEACFAFSHDDAEGKWLSRSVRCRN